MSPSTVPELHQALIQAGVKAVYYANDYHNDPYAEELLASHHVPVTKLG